ncbi:MAG: peptide deformylase [Candidatus Paceibacterota bacterium]|jgi:peptide deformylase
MTFIAPEQKNMWTIFRPNQEKLLRHPVAPFDFSAYSKKDIDELIRHMRSMMVKYKGVGLSANQIGLNMSVFVCQLPSSNGKGYRGKFYAIFNPRIVAQGEKKILDPEGCLSVPGYYGDIDRSERVTLEGFDKNERPLVIKAQGFLASIFQHETDHLNGRIFLDRARNIVRVESAKEE